MLRISEFYGIVIEMYWSDHNPPHFHAKYGEHHAEIEIRTLGILRGRLPAKALNLVMNGPRFIRTNFWRYGSGRGITSRLIK
jgi:hypothetical protein